MKSSTVINIPPDLAPPDLGIITSAYGPEEAGDLSGIVGYPPVVEGDGPQGLPGVERIKGPTPHGGVYAVAYFSRDGIPVAKSEATAVEIVEYDAQDGVVFRTYGKLGRF